MTNDVSQKTKSKKNQKIQTDRSADSQRRRRTSTDEEDSVVDVKDTAPFTSTHIIFAKHSIGKAKLHPIQTVQSQDSNKDDKNIHYQFGRAASVAGRFQDNCFDSRQTTAGDDYGTAVSSGCLAMVGTSSSSHDRHCWW